MGTRYGSVSIDTYLIPRCRITQFTNPLLAESIAFWNIVITVSGRSSTNASCVNKKYNIRQVGCSDL